MHIKYHKYTNVYCYTYVYEILFKDIYTYTIILNNMRHIESINCGVHMKCIFLSSDAQIWNRYKIKIVHCIGLIII